MVSPCRAFPCIATRFHLPAPAAVARLWRQQYRRSLPGQRRQWASKRSGERGEDRKQRVAHAPASMALSASSAASIFAVSFHTFVGTCPPQQSPCCLILWWVTRTDSPEVFGQQIQDLVDAFQMVVPLEYTPQRRYISMACAAESRATKRGSADRETNNKGGKKSKSHVLPVAAVSLDEAELGRCVVFVCVWLKMQVPCLSVHTHTRLLGVFCRIYEFYISSLPVLTLKCILFLTAVFQIQARCPIASSATASCAIYGDQRGVPGVRSRHGRG